MRQATRPPYRPRVPGAERAGGSNPETPRRQSGRPRGAIIGLPRAERGAHRHPRVRHHQLLLGVFSLAFGADRSSPALPPAEEFPVSRKASARPRSPRSLDAGLPRRPGNRTVDPRSLSLSLSLSPPWQKSAPRDAQSLIRKKHSRKSPNPCCVGHGARAWLRQGRAAVGDDGGPFSFEVRLGGPW